MPPRIYRSTFRKLQDMTKKFNSSINTIVGLHFNETHLNIVTPASSGTIGTVLFYLIADIPITILTYSVNPRDIATQTKITGHS